MPDDHSLIQWCIRGIKRLERRLTSTGPGAHAPSHHPSGSDELLLNEDDMASASDDKGASQDSIINHLAHNLSAFFDFFLTDTASADIGGYFKMQDMESGAARSTFPEAGLGAGTQLVDTWASPIGEPGSHILVGGIYDAHFHAKRTGGNKDLQFYWELYTRTHPAGAETLRMTSETSGFITDEAELDLHATIPSDIAINITDRLIFKLYAVVSGVGANIDLEVYAEGADDSHVTVPITTGIFSNIFLRQDGQKALTADWNAGAFDVTFQDLTIGTPSNIYALSHDAFADYDGNEHVDHTGVTLSAGLGLSGGGDISVNRAFALDLNELTDKGSIVAADMIAIVDSVDNGSKKVSFADFESILAHDSLSGVTANQHIDWTNAVENFQTDGTATIGDGAGTEWLSFDGGAGFVRDMKYQTGGLSRWVLRCNAAAEAGADAGSDFEILARTDGGGAAGTPVKIIRAGAVSNTLYLEGGNTGLGMVPPADARLAINLTTKDLEFHNAGTIGATEQAWIEVEIGGVTGYVWVRAGK